MRRCAREGIDWPRTSNDALDGTPFGATPPRWFVWWDGSDPLRARLEHADRMECSDNVRCPAYLRILEHLRSSVSLP